MTRRIVIVGCVEAKALPVTRTYPQPRLPAKDMYVSPLFRKRRAYAEQQVAAGFADRWGIVSALFHVMHPDHEIPSYDWSMKDWRKSELATWGYIAATGFDSVRRLVCDGGCVRSCDCLHGWTVEIHAGAAYVDPMRPFLEAEGATVETPLARLGIGEQLSWYGSQRSQLRLFAA